MKRDQLYLLKPGFRDQGATYYCPSCAELAGLLAFYPALQAKLEVHYVDFPRPRPELASRLGEANQSCPVLVLAENSTIPDAPAVRQANGHGFVAGAREIGKYLARRHGIDLPH
ncbi:MAG TPA: DUF3088 family protein [Lacunisphaera sp.]|nr:DUF3088 family protein [Lacunisphaera sp.]